MDIDFTGVQQMDDSPRHAVIVPVEYRGREISRVRERGHAPYRCTRGFIGRDVDPVSSGVVSVPE